MLAFSEACERNKQPILDVLVDEFSGCGSVLEIGSGTGQHAVHFANGMPHVEWQPTECDDEIASLHSRVRAEAPQNVRLPLPLDVCDSGWPGPFDAVFTANTLHIMSWDAVMHFFRGAGQSLAESGVLCVYGPFFYDDVQAVPSNVAFDLWLKERDPESGIRSFAAVNELAGGESLVLQSDYEMPANNRLIVWRRG